MGYVNQVLEALKIDESKMFVAGQQQFTLVLKADNEQRAKWISQSLGTIQTIKHMFVAAVEA
eukprot:5274651-Amphidinium_carterae.1